MLKCNQFTYTDRLQEINSLLARRGCGVQNSLVWPEAPELQQLLCVDLLEVLQVEGVQLAHLDQVCTNTYTDKYSTICGNMYTLL